MHHTLTNPETMKKLFMTLMLAISAGTMMAQTVREEIAKNPYLAGNQSAVYPTPTSRLTPAPRGYKPCYMSHYGRHGSRFNIGSIYTDTYNIMYKAASLGKLTPLGMKTMTQVGQLRDEAKGRDGELTSVGAEQHRGIAERMYKNFPEIFANERTTIDAKATTVTRCILSMENAMLKLTSLNPKLTIRHDASVHDMWYMNQSDHYLDSISRSVMWNQGKFSATKIHPDRLMEQIFSDQQYWRDSLRAGGLMKQLFDMAMHVQNSEIRNTVDMTGLFTADELYDLWQVTNAYWYLNCACSPLTNAQKPYTQRNLLRRMIEEADSCLQLDHPSASLRYGHDGMVLPLNCLMELDETAAQLQLEELAEKGWCDYKIIPMACNIQMVFYRSTDVSAPILVKVLRNENEAHLPVKTDTWPYYRWDDVKQYYLTKLDAYSSSRAVER